jgi:hypothetical protein
MPQEKLSFHKFGEGFISEYDIGGLFAPPIPTMYSPYPEGSCKDISNFEINAPRHTLKESTGSDLVYALPSYAGSRIVAHKNWKVTTPSSQSITTLITASSNMLLYSENFDVSPTWTFTAGSATLTPNSQQSPAFLLYTRMADRLTNVNSSTLFRQYFNGIWNTQYTFSVYFKKTTANRIRLTIGDNVNHGIATSNDASGTWQRLTVTYTCTGNTGFLVYIDFPDSAGSDTFDIWGAQLELGAVATNYGYTFHYNLPYYIFQRPYWNGVSWVDRWQELTEMRCGKISASADGTFTITGLNESSGYYNNWYVWIIGSVNPTGYITSYTYGSGVFNIVGKKIANDGTFVVISKFPFFTETPYLQQGLVVEKNITFVEVNDDLKLSFGNTHRPLTIKYINTSIMGVVGGSEVLVPSSDITIQSGWTPYPPIPTTLYDKINKLDSGDSSTDIEAIGAGAGAYYETKFNTLTEVVGTPTVANYSYRVISINEGIRVDLYSGSTLIHTGIPTGLGVFGIFNEYLTPGEVATITGISGGWSDLRVRIINLTADSQVSTICCWCNLFVSGFAGSTTTPFSKNEFSLTYSSHIGVQPPSENVPVLPVATLEESEGVGFGSSVISLTQGTSGALTLLAQYKVYVVGVIDGNQRIPIWTGSTTLTGSNDSINIIIPIVTAGFDWRLTALEIYIGQGVETPGDTSAYFFYCTVLMKDIVNGVLTTSAYDNNWTITVNVSAMDSLQSTLLYNIGGCLDIIETRARYNVAYYLLGRMFIAQTQETGNIIRYSNINGLISEIDKFAYSDGGYGFFTSDSSANQTIMNIGRTIENDLLIIRENDVSLFEVQSGNSSAKRLRQLFTGIGSSNTHSLVISDYGNFWYDNNDVYFYQGGYSVPTKISEGKIRHYWRTVLAPYIATSFAIFNRQVNEYWIFIQRSATATDWIVLRFSPEFGNWNIWNPGFIPVWLSEEIDGTVTMAQAVNIYKFGGTAIMSNPFVITHKRKISPDAITPKQVEEVYISNYTSSNNITMTVTIDNETSIRTGNSPVFVSTKKSQRRSIRSGSSMNYATIGLSVNAGGSTQIDEFGLIVNTRKDRTSARK